MLKAELELYSHYMLIDHLNSQKNYNETFDKDTIEKPQIKSRPDLFQHKLISQVILFSAEKKKKS